MEKKEFVFKEEDLKLYESFNKQYLSHFPDKPEGIPRESRKTCDTHLDSKQSIRMIDPKGNGMEEGTWNEPMDINQYWESKVPIIWLIISLCSIFFFLMIYYNWGT